MVASCVVAAPSFVWMIGLGLYGQAERSTGGGVVSLDGSSQETNGDPSRISEETEGVAAEPANDQSSDPGIVLLRLSVIFGVPLVSLVLALAARTRRAAIAARGVATLVLAGLALLTVFSAGPGFALAMLLMGAATALAVTEPSGESA